MQGVHEKMDSSFTQGSTSRTGAVAVSAVPVSRPDSKTRDRSGNAGNWSETPETARFPVPGLHREITSRREVKPCLYLEEVRCRSAVRAARYQLALRRYHQRLVKSIYLEKLK